MTSSYDLQDFLTACRSGNSGRVKQLLSNHSIGANEKICINHDIFTPLYLSISPGFPESSSYEILSMLLSNGADPNELCSNHGTPLCVASQKKDARFVKKLLEYGADPNTVGELGDSPLFASIGAPGDDNEVKAALIEAGADIEFVNPAGYPLLFMAANVGKPNFVELLLAHGADINKGYSDDFSLFTPLNIAVVRRQYATVRILLEHGALEFDMRDHPVPKVGNSVSLDSIYGLDQKMEDLLISYGARPTNEFSREEAHNLHNSALMLIDMQRIIE